MERSEIRARSCRVIAEPRLRGARHRAGHFGPAPLAPSGLPQKIFPEPLARGKRFAEIETVDDGQAEAAGRHGVLFRRAVLMEGDLHAGDAGRALDLVNDGARRMPVAAAARTEQHDAITFAAVVVVKI